SPCHHSLHLFAKTDESQHAGIVQKLSDQALRDECLNETLFTSLTYAPETLVIPSTPNHKNWKLSFGVVTKRGHVTSYQKTRSGYWYGWLYSKDNKGDGKQDEKTENKKKRYFIGIMQVIFIKCVSCLGI
ncbi:hypothetical protein, partial [Komagataeibacter saccharivorans]|uniref:hypothetical protein n=1 Tax=Komagataeibacter saccharivorans TaxID=265959 RepID=UPI0039E85474